MGLFNLFPKKDNSESITLEKFCNILSSGEQINILKTLNLPLSRFTKATTVQINSNPEDKRNGAVEVYIVDNIKIFGIFDHCVLKIYKKFDKQFMFYTTTSNADVIFKFANILYEKLGAGLFDDRKYNSFRDLDKIENIAKGFCSSERDECDTMWLLESNLTIWLQYHVNPLKQFVFQILEKQIVERVNKSRTDSITKYINFDLNKIIENSTNFGRVVENGQLKFVDYTANLPEPFLGIFDIIQIRIFSDQKVFDENIQTHLTFLTQNKNININNIKIVTDSLISIYGKDSTDSDKLIDYEIASIKKNGYWLGRNYVFNEEHELWDSKNANESILYSIQADYNISFTDEGLTLSINFFNKLIKWIGNK